MGTYEYTMTKEFTKAILTYDKREKGSKQDILCRYVNSQMGIKGTCIKVIVE